MKLIIYNLISAILCAMFFFTMGCSQKFKISSTNTAKAIGEGDFYNLSNLTFSLLTATEVSERDPSPTIKIEGALKDTLVFLYEGKSCNKELTLFNVKKANETLQYQIPTLSTSGVYAYSALQVDSKGNKSKCKHVLTHTYFTEPMGLDDIYLVSRDKINERPNLYDLEVILDNVLSDASITVFNSLDCSGSKFNTYGDSSSLTLSNLNFNNLYNFSLHQTKDTYTSRCVLVGSFQEVFGGPLISLSGYPVGLSNIVSLNVSVSGANVYEYKYDILTGESCDSASYSSYISSSTSITSSLGAYPEGSLSLCVIAKNSQGLETSSATKVSWTKCGVLECLASGSTGCIVTGNFVAVDKSKISARLLQGSTLLGVAGTYTGGVPDPSTVKSGVNYKGLNGIDLTGSLDLPEVSNVLNTAQVGDSYGSLVDRGLWDLSSATFSGAGYYSGVSNLPAPYKICLGTTIFGVFGTADCDTVVDNPDVTYVPVDSYLKIMGAGLHRKVNKLESTMYDEYTQNLAYHYDLDETVANLLYGFTGNTSAKPMTSGERADTDCGGNSVSFVSTDPIVRVDEMAEDCKTKNPTKTTTWTGESRGNNSEGTWRLVVRKSGYEVWQDMRTGLLWSDYLAITNWCRAVGNKDTSDIYCNDNTYQPTSAPESWCAEGSPFTTPTIYDDQKGGLKLGSTPSKIKWWLPTAGDYMLAAANGIHLVLPNMSGQYFWSASVSSSNTESALFFHGPHGYLHNAMRYYDNFVVRCVGSVF